MSHYGLANGSSTGFSAVDPAERSNHCPLTASRGGLQSCFLSLLAVLLLFGFVFAPGANAQATEGTILGTITDSSNAAVVGAHVRVTNVLTNIARTTVTNESGGYVVSNLPLGSYSVAAEMPGFKRAVQPPVEMTVKARIRVDLKLEVGEVSQTVEISAAAPLLKTDTAEVSNLVNNEQLQALPDLNRNFLAMSVLTPGALRTYNTGRVVEFSGGEGVQIGTAGVNQNNFILDGISNNIELTGGMNAVPPIEAIQEFSIQTNGYSAEFGRSGGGVINVALKSGTNQYHGFAYEFLQNDILDARSYDFSGTNPKKPPLRKNLFGAGLGGPLKKNKIFFFGNYEGMRQPQNVIQYVTVPTALERKGDFSQSGWTVYDPATLNGNTRQPFAGNIIPTGRISPIMSKLISIYPIPNYKDPNPSVLNNFLAFNTNRDTRNSMNAKSDFVLGQNDTVAVHFTKQLFSKDRSGYMPESWIGGHATLNGNNLGASETHVFSPSVVNEVRIGWNYIDDGNFNSNTTTIEELKQIPGGVVQTGYPTVSMRNITSTKAVRPLTTLPTPYTVQQNSIQGMDNLSWHWKNHAFKFGFDYIHHRNTNGGGWAPGGIKFSIDGYQTVATVGGKRPSNITGTADGLLGLMNQLTTYHYGEGTTMYAGRYAGFMQDDWRINRKLSLSLGLRYEKFRNWNWKDDLAINFDLTSGLILVPDTLKSFVQGLGIPGGVLPSNYKYVPYDQVRPHSNTVDMSPRLGFAYSMTDKVVLRGGWGIFYSTLDALTMNNTNGPPVSFQVQITGDTLTPIKATDGFPTGGAYDTVASNGVAPAQYPISYPDPSLQKWNFNIQYSPFTKTVVELGYEGSYIGNDVNSTRLNYPRPAPGDIQSRRPYPAFGEGFGNQFDAVAHYNAVELTLRQRQIWGLSVQSVLTLMHATGTNGYIDPYNLDYSYGMLGFDYSRQWVTSFIYSIPTKKDWNKFLQYSVGGWQASSIIQVRGGFPFSVSSAQAMNDDIDASRANYITTAGPAALPTSQRSINGWFNTNAFVTPADYTWGNSGINILRGPGFSEVEFALQKSFTPWEGKRFTFRAEAINALNHVNLGQPAATVDDSGYGTIRSLRGDPRLMQMSMRLDF